MTETDASSPVELTRSRLATHRGRYREISDKCGASYSWLIKFVHGKRGRRPSFERLTKLQTVLDEIEREKDGVTAAKA